MVPRFLIAAIGGSLITSAMLLGMNHFAQALKAQDPTQYFQVADFFAAPADRRPVRPAAPELPPERPQIHHSLPQDLNVSIPGPALDDERIAPPPLIPEPRTDR